MNIEQSAKGKRGKIRKKDASKGGGAKREWHIQKNEQRIGNHPHW